jgi:hypothetical protein
MLTTNERTASQPRGVPGVADDELRVWARKHVERVRRLKRDVSVYVLGMVTLTTVWALVEWQDNGAFERLSTDLGLLRRPGGGENLLRSTDDRGRRRARHRAAATAQVNGGP